MSSTGPIETVSLFPELSRRLLALLEGLAPEDWNAPVSTVWRVRDVAAHLIDSSLRRLSAQRDGHKGQQAQADGDYPTLLAYLNRLNAEWVAAMDRVSPRVLMDLLRWSDEQLFALFSSLDPHGPAIWPVAWAGESRSENWFDIAREYTEKWHHAQQIFEATGRPSTIDNRELMHPCLDTLMRALPHGLRHCNAPTATAVCIRVTGDAGGRWMLVREQYDWRLRDAVAVPTAATVTLHQDDAWKVLMKRVPAPDARLRFRVQVDGDQQLGDAVLETVCVMA